MRDAGWRRSRWAEGAEDFESTGWLTEGDGPFDEALFISERTITERSVVLDRYRDGVVDGLENTSRMSIFLGSFRKGLEQRKGGIVDEMKAVELVDKRRGQAGRKGVTQPPK